MEERDIFEEGAEFLAAAKEGVLCCWGIIGGELRGFEGDGVTREKVFEGFTKTISIITLPVPSTPGPY